MPSLPPNFAITSRQIREQEIDVKYTSTNFYVVRARGFVSLTGDLHPVNEGFNVVSCKFGGDSTHDDFHPTVRRFVAAMKAMGIQPEFERNEDGPNFCFWFDISSREGRAYYELATANHGQEIVAMVFAERIGPDIIVNAKDVDRAIFNLIAECGVEAY